MNIRQHFAAVLVSLALIFTACSSEKPEEKKTDAMRVSMDYTQSFSFTDKSMTYLANNGILHFYDIDSGYDTVICSKANCRHEGASSSNPTPECDGYVEGPYTTCTAIINDNLYFIYTPDIKNNDYAGFSTKKLCRAKTDGTSRKDIAEISNAQSVSSACYNEGYLTLGYSNTFDEKGNDLEKSQSSICAIDLTDGTVISSSVKEGYQGQIRKIYFSDDVITYAYFYLSEKIDYDDWDIESDEFSEYIKKITKTEIIQFNISDNKEKVIWSGSGTCESIDFGYACIVDTEPEIIRLSDMKTYSLGSEFTDCSLSIDEGGVIISDYANSKYSFFDFKTETVREIGTISESGYMIITAITDNKIYVTYTEKGDIALGNIEKEDFYSGKFSSVKFIKNYDEDLT